MPIINRIAEFHDDMKTWRRHLHANPELQFDCHRTAAFVVEQLRAFGVDEIHERIAESGVVAIIEGTGAGPTIGLRADMDALPMTETTGLAHASAVEGRMHACGHDGHTAMLLGAARYLAETRRFSGRVALIFQPAEEMGGGGKVMCDEGIMERFAIARVFGVHNYPGVPVGQFMINSGPVLAAADSFEIAITGEGGHGALPEHAVDPVAAALQVAQGIQTIVARNVPSQDRVVVSVTVIRAGTVDNIIPHHAHIGGTVRTLTPRMRALVERRLGEICAGTAQAFGVRAELNFIRGYPATVNDPEQTAFAADVAREIGGAAGVDDAIAANMGAEDFAFMLMARPGAYMGIGQGDSAPLHHPDFDFNDEIGPIGASYFARLVETAQPPVPDQSVPR